MTTAILLLSCPDQRGLVAEVSTFVADHGGNIVLAEQHTDAGLGVFFQRVEFELDSFDLARDQIVPALASNRTACTTCSPGGTTANSRSTSRS